MVNNSNVDFKNVKNRIQFIKAQTGCGQFPKITLIHGRLSDLELATLYKNDKVKAFITLTHGEGYGLPIIEAAACGLPVIATNWSGHLDFLKVGGKNKFIPLDYKLEPIPPSRPM
jgi:glycosyltransferase involved in cell wall biosynthesis